MKTFICTLCALVLMVTFPFAAHAAEPGHSMPHGQGKKNDMPRQNMSQGGMGMSQGGMGMMRRHMDSRPYSDKMFLSAMIPHHEGALVMAQAVLKDGEDPRVKKWAEEVIDTQTAEIKDMQEWLDVLGGQEPESADTMRGVMHRMMSSPMNADPDRNFVEMMIVHHVAALEMAIVSLEKSNDQNILELSKAILKVQAEEIYDYRRWLLKK